MSTNLLGQLLGNVFSGARGGAQSQGGLGDLFGGAGGSGGAGGAMSGSGGGGGLGGLLGGLLGGGQRPGAGIGGGMGGIGGIGGKGALLAILLPLAMQWVQRSGGIGNVLGRFQQRGLSQQAASWVSTGENQPIDGQAMADVMGDDELSRLSQQLGVSRQEVSDGFGEILPEMVNHLTPDGTVPADADDVLANGSSMLERMFGAQRAG